MIVTRRTHRLGIGSARVVLDRGISERFLLRRVEFHELVQDERRTKAAVEVDCERPRRRLLVSISSESQCMVGSDDVRLRSGDMLFVPESAPHAGWWGVGETLELEWDPGAFGDDPNASLAPRHARVTGPTRAAFEALAKSVREGLPPDVIHASLAAALGRLRDEGVLLDPAACLLGGTDPPAEALIRAVDAALTDLSTSPDTVDLEMTLACSRRTLTRRMHEVCTRYGLLGRGEGRWRGLRDKSRLLVATIFLSHREATPAHVAKVVGYRSVEALHHALAAAQLPPPRALQRALVGGRRATLASRDAQRAPGF